MRLAAVALLALTCATQTLAAPPTIDVALSHTGGRVGDPIEVTLTITRDADQHVGDPQIGDLPRDVVQSDSLEPLPEESVEGGQMSRVWHTVLVPFRTGDLDLPDVTVRWTTTDGASGEVAASLGTVTVDSVLALGATPPLPEPPEGPFNLPVPRPRWPYYVGVGVLIAALAAWWIARRLARRGEPVVARPRRVRPPHEVALEDLEALADSDLVARGELRPVFFLMTDIVRLYFEREFGIGAPEMTSTELLAALHDGEFPAPLCDTTQRWVSACDLVKFASQIPRVDHCHSAITLAKAIVTAAHQHHLARQEVAAEEAA